MADKHIKKCSTSLIIAIAIAIAKSLQLCPTLCDPIDGSPPGCPVPGILQAGTLEWVAISFTKDLSLRGYKGNSSKDFTLCTEGKVDVIFSPDHFLYILS